MAPHPTPARSPVRSPVDSSTRSSALLTSADLPWPELQAAALDGDVFRIDRAFCSIAEFDVPWRRATALADLCGREFVVAGRSAAWVWGALAQAPGTHEGFGETRRGLHDVPTGLFVRAVDPPEDDLVDFGPVRVTAPARTIVDLVRFDLDEGATAEIVAFLIAEHRVDRATCDAILARGRTLPHRRRARSRLAQMWVRPSEPG
ncbi:type IV toxin-antitoxin system AbiEi family antitoxin [Frondihabitans australicus]|uniref:Transcriptional regulator with AbiEi antitoxin domain of type IV toxin-antitoxin system n=1 Tax=Frondihabitans australicus TaxID=386892 RepID=A0A495IDK6_9MICO|nr:type IV toxin-antitoxin system AbiEi family antitoxin [Frondihabitans australicus]RKR74083.1 transcriptional regulator with AbiEi antitoxin domain of type IV toxin-antitoxin system [Frondihabitans australicus]